MFIAAVVASAIALGITYLAPRFVDKETNGVVYDQLTKGRRMSIVAFVITVLIYLDRVLMD